MLEGKEETESKDRKVESMRRDMEKIFVNKGIAIMQNQRKYVKFGHSFILSSETMHIVLDVSKRAWKTFFKI